MNVFEEVKSRVSARKVAEAYGLKINYRGMACCPFHNDKHPSMKIDNTHYHCFGCGAHGDAIGFVAASLGIGQYEAACKINEDLNLGIATDRRPTESEQTEYRKKTADKKKIAKIKGKLREWRLTNIRELRECEELIERSEKAVMDSDSHVAIISAGFMYLMHMKSIVGYWLDILCMGTEEEVREFFLTDGKEVSRVVAGIKRAGDDILGRNRKAVG